jgi:hypothetical protein
MEHELGWAPEDDPGIGRDEIEAALGQVVGAGRSRRARRRLVGSGLLAMALVVGGAGVIRLTSGSGEESNLHVTGDPGKDTSTTPVPDGDATPGQSKIAVPGATPTTAKPGTAVPATVLLARPYDTPTMAGGSEIVVYDIKAKKAVRTVYRGMSGITSMSVSGEGGWIYFGSESCGSDPLHRVKLAGPPDQEPQIVDPDPAGDPEVSPDGRQVAYIAVRQECGDEGARIVELRVRDVAGGPARVVAKNTARGLASPSWSPDGKSIAVTASDEAGPYTVVLDASGTNADPASGRRVPAPRPGYTFITPQFLADGTLFGQELPVKGTGRGGLMSVVDATTGQRIRSVATGDATRSYGGTQADRSGNHLLYLSFPDTGGPGGDLRLSSNGDRTVVLATSVLAAAW